MLQEVGSVGGRVRVAWPKRRVQIQASLVFKGQQRMVAFAVCPLVRAGLIAVYRFYCGVQIENDVKGQAGSDDFLIQRLQFGRKLGTIRA